MYITKTNISSFAVTEYNSRGRQYPILLAKDRSAFQRDYTRILHSKSFRRLQGKTQVFLAECGDMMDTYRTRMSHSIEVEQIARSIARSLNVNEDLCGALAIGHDIGHSPFGHLGQDVLNKLFQDIGGFEHNYQALRIVDLLEKPYPDYNGLNLMFETREGLLKHCSQSRAKKLGSVAERHLQNQSPPIEVQIVDEADQIAYLHGDLEDALDKNLLDVNTIHTIPGFQVAYENILKDKPDFKLNKKDKSTINEIWRKMMSLSIDNLIIQSRSNIELFQIETLSDVRLHSPIITHSPEQNQLLADLRNFSIENIYNHESVMDFLKYEDPN